MIWEKRKNSYITIPGSKYIPTRININMFTDSQFVQIVEISSSNFPKLKRNLPWESDLMHSKKWSERVRR